jgi:hypothetical protein
VEKYIVERGRPQMTMWRMRVACWIPKATNSYSECVMFISFSTATMIPRMRPQCYVTRILPVLCSVKLGSCCVDPNTLYMMSHWKAALGDRYQNSGGSRRPKPGTCTFSHILLISVRITFFVFSFRI